MRYVLDTTAFSAAMKHDSDLFNLLANYRPGDVVTAPPVVAEIQYGINRLENSSKKYHLLSSERDRLLSIISILTWTPESSEQFGKIKAELERQGDIIDDFDIAIAAIALAHMCGVITANLNHFRRINDLESQSWNE